MLQVLRRLIMTHRRKKKKKISMECRKKKKGEESTLPIFCGSIYIFFSHRKPHLFIPVQKMEEDAYSKIYGLFLHEKQSVCV